MTIRVLALCVFHLFDDRFLCVHYFLVCVRRLFNHRKPEHKLLIIAQDSKAYWRAEIAGRASYRVLTAEC